MQNINDRLWNLLFCKKDVTLNNDYYHKLYYSIWGDESLFFNFLQSKSENEQKRFSLKIFDRLMFDSAFPIPSFTFKALIHSEDLDTLIPHNNYQGRVHSSHSVMVYILGIWLFFNHPVFNSYIIKQFTSIARTNCLEDIIASFISAWKIFSLGHDLGYVFEGSVSPSKHCPLKKYDELLANYNNLDEIVFSQLVLTSMTNIFYVQCIINDSNTSIQDDLYIDLANTYLSFEDDLPIDLKELSFLSNDDYTLLNSINSFKQLTPFLAFIKPEDLVIVIKDKSQVVFIQNDDIQVYWESYNKTQLLHLLKDHNQKNSFVQNSDIKIEFFVKSAASIVESFFREKNLHPYYCYFRDANRTIKGEFNFKFLTAITDNDHDNIRFAIFDYINNQFNIDTLFAGKPQALSKKKETDSIKTCLENVISVIIQNKEIDSTQRNNAKEIYKHVIDELQKEETLKHFISQATLQIKGNFIETLFNALPNIIKDMPQKSNKLLITKKEKGARVAIDFNYLYEKVPISSSPIKEKINALLTMIIKYGKELGIIHSEEEYNNLFNYHNNSHTSIDHGVASAAFILQAYSIYDYFQKNGYSLKLDNQGNDYNIFSQINYTEKDQIIGIAVFGILLHNIYPSIYKELFNTQYVIRLDKNPFCFFSALCDNLQKWDRPALLDYSKDQLQGDYITGMSYDLEIKNKIICIHCKTTNLQNSINSQKSSLNAFLENASSFIKLDLYE